MKRLGQSAIGLFARTCGPLLVLVACAPLAFGPPDVFTCTDFASLPDGASTIEEGHLSVTVGTLEAPEPGRFQVVNSEGIFAAGAAEMRLLTPPASAVRLVLFNGGLERTTSVRVRDANGDRTEAVWLDKLGNVVHLNGVGISVIAISQTGPDTELGLIEACVTVAADDLGRSVR